jgi:hypothetical protein
MPWLGEPLARPAALVYCLIRLVGIARVTDGMCVWSFRLGRIQSQEIGVS